jgi:hypothetical protein
VHLSELSTKELQQVAIQLKIRVQKVIDLLWLFMELHMMKLMMLSIMLLCVFDVSGASIQHKGRWGHFKDSTVWRYEIRKKLCDSESFD